MGHRQAKRIRKLFKLHAPQAPELLKAEHREYAEQQIERVVVEMDNGDKIPVVLKGPLRSAGVRKLYKIAKRNASAGNA